jgi:hypothetical protein
LSEILSGKRVIESIGDNVTLFDYGERTLRSKIQLEFFLIRENPENTIISQIETRWN